MRLSSNALVPALAACLLAGASSAAAQSTGFTMRAAPSGRATTTVTLAYPRDSAPPGAQPATIWVNYGQPHLRGRRPHSDSLVPFGTPWRTGANEATMLGTQVDLTIGGQPVPKGRYIVWTVPAAGDWTMILQPTAAETPPAAVLYKEVPGQVRIPMRRQALPGATESLTFWIVPATGVSGAARGELRMAWGSSLLTADWVAR